MPEKMSRSNMQTNETKILQLTHVSICSIEYITKNYCRQRLRLM